jgi:hypothetical protein
MREMNGASIQARMHALQDGATDRGRGSAALDELRVMLSRAAQRRQAYAMADAGRLARQNWHVYRV